MELDINEEKLNAPITEDTDKERYYYNTWVKYNRLSLKFLRMSVASNIQLCIPKTNSSMEFFNSVKERSQMAVESLMGIVMVTLTTIKYNGSSDMHEHVVKITNLSTTLGSLNMHVHKNFLI